ncbi:hypothetical protein BT69DRAFT_1349448 [Atractiella rhizophila]|nr:hypothetical protein BT69DRAFT_1349448 [Atractiella rhizophila]
MLQPTIKCSTCGTSVQLDHLTTHICRRPLASTPSSSSSSLRVDTYRAQNAYQHHPPSLSPNSTASSSPLPSPSGSFDSSLSSPRIGGGASLNGSYGRKRLEPIPITKPLSSPGFRKQETLWDEEDLKDVDGDTNAFKFLEDSKDEVPVFGLIQKHETPKSSTRNQFNNPVTTPKASFQPRPRAASRAHAHKPTESQTQVGLEECIQDLLRVVVSDDPRTPSRSNTEPSPVTANSAAGSAPLVRSASSVLPPTNNYQSELPYSSSVPNVALVEQGRREYKVCSACNRVIKQGEEVKKDAARFCISCYRDRYLPKCRRCKLAIEGKSVGSGDGKVLGRYHPHCFVCKACARPFPNKEFYVYDGAPYCEMDYHQANGSICRNRTCGRGIEGPCVSLVGKENGGGGRYHPQCFTCSYDRCERPLSDFHFVVGGLPYCEPHAERTLGRSGQRQEDNSGSTSRAVKRQTIITNRRR